MALNDMWTAYEKAKYGDDYDFRKKADDIFQKNGMNVAMTKAELGALDASSNQPQMDIPTSLLDATALYKGLSEQTRMPGQDLYEQQIGQNTAQGMAAAREASTSAGDVLGAYSTLYGQQNQAMTNLQIEASRQQAMNQNLYGQQLNTLGQAEQQQYYMNEYYPWMTEMNMAQQNIQNTQNRQMAEQQMKQNRNMNLLGMGVSFLTSGGVPAVTSAVSGLFNR